MDQNKRHAVALMKYSAIAPLISGTQDDYESLRAYYRDASAKGLRKRMRISMSSMKQGV